MQLYIMKTGTFYSGILFEVNNYSFLIILSILYNENQFDTYNENQFDTLKTTITTLA